MSENLKGKLIILHLDNGYLVNLYNSHALLQWDQGANC